jgi:hypothetical protein
VDTGADLNGCEPSRPPLGFDSRTVQPVASRYTDHANPAYRLQRSEVKEIVEISLKNAFLLSERFISILVSFEI